MAAIRFGLIGRYLRPYRRTVLLGVAALVVVNLLSVTLPLLVRRVIDDLQDGFEYSDVLLQAALIVALATVMAGVRLWSRMLVFGVGRQVEASLKQQIFDHMLRQEPSWVQTTGSGEVISRATSDVENVRRLLGFAVLSLTNTALAYTVTLPAMLAIDPLLSLAAVGLYPLMLVTVRLFGGRMMRQQRRQQEALAQLSDLIQEDLSGINAIKIYGQEATEQQAFAERNRRYRDDALQLARTRSTLFPLLEGISSVSLLLLLALGSGQLESASSSIGDLVALILYVERLVFPTALLGFTLNTFQTGQVSLERVEQLLHRKPRITSPAVPQPVAPPPRAGRSAVAVEAHGLSLRYPDAERPALDGLSFRLEPGELVAVVALWVAAKPRWPGPWDGWWRWPRASCSSMAPISPAWRWRTYGAKWRWCPRRVICSPPPWPTTCATGSRKRNRARWSKRRSRRGWRATSAASPMATALWWASAASPSAVASASAPP